MKTLYLLAAAIFCASAIAEATSRPTELYSTDYWEITGQPGKITWIEIHNSKEAQTSGIAHVMIVARKKGAPVWEIEHVCDHIAITTDALQRSVVRPFKTRGVYPERFFEAYDRWKQAKKDGTAIICSTSIRDYLQHQ